jgi:hypothetical protein
MFFTLEDLKRIEDWLIKRSKKDTDFEKASPLKGGEELAIIQDGKNKRLSIRELVGQLSGESGDIDKGVLYDSVHSVGVNFGFSDEVKIWHEKNNGEVSSESIPAASQYAAGVMSKDDKRKLDSIVPCGLAVLIGEGKALNISDSNGNILVRFSGGHVRTKFFDSRRFSNDRTPDDLNDVGTSIIVKDADFSDVSIGDSPIDTEDLKFFAYNFPFTVGG